VRVLIPNLGSTSLKYQLIDMEGERVLVRGKIERIGSPHARVTTWIANGHATETTTAIPNYRAAIEVLLARVGELKIASVGYGIDAVGFKAVHGGPSYCGSFRVDHNLLAEMKRFELAAPVHNSIYIQAMHYLREILPGVPMVAVFESGFHATIPERAFLYGVPYEWLEQYGVRRYGFHGSSHRYVSQRVSQILGRSAAGLRLISCHLGGSSSICAVMDGKSVDCTFGFSAQSGIEHAARCGDFDAFAALYVMERANLSPAQIRDILCTQSGLLGISGVSNDLRDIEAAAAGGNRRAALAIEVLVHEIRRYIGAFAAVMGGVDAIAFTGGIGENSVGLREQACRNMEFLGILLDQEKNRAPGMRDRVISRTDSRVTVLVVCTNEEIIVARETVRVLTQE